MLGKVIGKLFKIICFVLLFMLLTSLIGSTIKDFVNDYDVFNTEDNLAVVTEKISKKSLTGTPAYYVMVDLNDADIFNGIKNRVFSWQFKHLEVGDTIKGHHIHGHHFFTTLDIIEDSLVVTLVLTLLCFFLAMLLCWPLFVYLEKWEKKKQNNSYQPKKHNKRKIIRENKQEKPSSLQRILPKSLHRFIPAIMKFLGILIVLLFTASFMMNGIGKLSPFGKVSTEGLVVGKDSRSEVNYYIGKVSDPYFSLAIEFSDDDQEVYTVIKEVTRSTFRKHDIGDSIKISHQNRNPSNVFVRDYALLNIMEIGLYVKFYFRMFALFILLMFLVLRMNRYRKEKEVR